MSCVVGLPWPASTHPAGRLCGESAPPPSPAPAPPADVDQHDSASVLVAGEHGQPPGCVWELVCCAPPFPPPPRRASLPHGACCAPSRCQRPCFTWRRGSLDGAFSTALSKACKPSCRNGMPCANSSARPTLGPPPGPSRGCQSFAMRRPCWRCPRPSSSSSCTTAST